MGYQRQTSRRIRLFLAALPVAAGFLIGVALLTGVLVWEERCADEQYASHFLCEPWNRPNPELGDSVNGPVVVLSTDTLRMGRRVIRLWGIKGISRGRGCKRSGQPWNCGVDAIQALKAFLRNETLTCNLQRRRFFST